MCMRGTAATEHESNPKIVKGVTCYMFEGTVTPSINANDLDSRPP